MITYDWAFPDSDNLVTYYQRNKATFVHSHYEKGKKTNNFIH